MGRDYTRSAMEEYDRISVAWRNRTVALLAKPYAQTYIAIFRTIFKDVTRQVPDDELYAALDSIKTAFDLADLGDAWPKAELSGEDGRAFCRRRLMQEFGWLQSQPDGTRPGHEVFRLSRNAMRVMSAIDELVDNREMASGDLMAIVLAQMDRLAAATSDDREEKIKYLQERRDEAQRELDEYMSGSLVLNITEDEADDAISTIVGLLKGFPMSFVALAGELDDWVRRIDEDYERGTPVGQIGKRYFHESHDILQDTAGGRNFKGVISVLSEPTKNEFSAKVDEIVSAAPLRNSATSRRALQTAWAQVLHGQECVYRAFRGARSTLAAYNLAFRSDERQVLRDALFRCESMARGWAAEVARGTMVPSDAICLRKTRVDHLRTNVSESAGDLLPPTPVLVVEPVQQDAPRDRDTAMGEPNIQRIARELLEVATAGEGGGEIDVARIWDRLPVRDGRLADAMAMYLRLAAAGGTVTTTTTTWRTHTPKGTESAYEGPSLIVEASEVAGLVGHRGKDGRG